MSAVSEAIAVLQAARATSDSAIVAFSGGKDSVVVMDMCKRTFTHVHAYFMYLAPDLDCFKPQMDYARDHFSVTPHQIMGVGAFSMIKRGVYCNPTAKIVRVPAYKLEDVYATSRWLAGLPDNAPIFDGQKRADSMIRRYGQALRVQGRNDLWHPLAGWTNQDVWAYLRRHNLEAPGSRKNGAPSSGIDLSEECLLWLSREYPQDIDRLRRLFPYIDAPLRRVEFFGDKKARQQWRRAQPAAASD